MKALRFFEILASLELFALVHKTLAIDEFEQVLRKFPQKLHLKSSGSQASKFCMFA